MRVAIAVSIVAIVALTAISTRSERWARPDARDRRFSRLVNTTNLTGDTSGPAASMLFHFADSTGTGMGTACACADVTGTLGEAITFTRASSAYCTTSLDNTGLSNSSIVLCATNKPRVKASTAGGALMLGMKLARTNNCPRSQSFDNATWAKIGSGAAAPIVTANAAVAPDGTTTAEEVVFAATPNTANRSSVVDIAGACAGTRDSAGVYVKGASGSGTLQVCMDTGGSPGEANCTSSVYVSTSWSRISRNNQTGRTRILIGNVTNNAGISQSANDVFLWQADCQPNTTTNPVLGEPILTTTAAASDASESATFAKPSGLTDAIGCAGVSSFIRSTSTPVGETMSFNTGNNMFDFSNTTTSRIQDATNTVTGTVTSIAGRLARQLGGWNTGDNTLKLYGEVSSSGAYDGTIVGSALGIGGNATDTTGSIDALVSDITVGNSQTVCQ